MDFGNFNHQMSVHQSKEENLFKKCAERENEIKHLRNEIINLRDQLEKTHALA